MQDREDAAKVAHRASADAVPQRNSQSRPEPNTRRQPGRDAPWGRDDIPGLQRLIGNQSVSMLLSHQPGYLTPATPAVVQRDATPPKVLSWSSKLTKGGQAKDMPRDLAAPRQKVYVGDAMTVTANFGMLTDEQRQAITFTNTLDGTYAMTGPSWQGNSASWKIEFVTVGNLSAKFGAEGALMPGASMVLGDYQESYGVVADLLDFMMACQAAQSDIIAKFASAETKLQAAATAFKKAQETQQKALTAAANAQKAGDDLVWAALFAAVGGFAGGAVGGNVKTVLEGLKPRLGNIAEGALTDAGKDFIKFTARSLDRLRGGGAPSVKGDSQAPSADKSSDPASKPGGSKEKASGESPFDFLTTVARKSVRTR